MLGFKQIIDNFTKEKSNNAAIRDNNETYAKAIAGEKQGNEAEGRSELVVKSISSILQKAIPALSEPFLSTSKPIRIAGVSDLTQKSFSERFANNFFKDEMDAVEFVEKMIGNYLKQDMLWVHADWESVKDGDTFLENRGKTRILDSSDVFFDSAAESQKDLRFVAVREKVNKYQLKAEVQGYGKMHDKDNLADAIANGNKNVYEVEDEHEGTVSRNVRENDITIIRYYGLDYNKKGKRVGFESAWVEGTEKRLYTISRDFPMNRLPFYYTSFFRDSNALTGKAGVYFLLDNQKIQTGLTRGILDNLENANNEKVFFEGRKVSTDTMIAYQQGKTFIPFGDTSKIKFKGYNALPQYVLNVKSENEKQADDLIGTGSRMGVTGSGKFTDDKLNDQISISETVQVFSVRKLGRLMSSIVKTEMIYSEWYLTEEQKMQHLPPGGTTEMFNNMDKVKMLDQTATSTTKANRVRELNLLLQQSKENGKYINEIARREIVADLAENLDKPMIADMIRIADLEPSVEEKMQFERARQKDVGEMMKLKKEIEELDSRIQANKMTAQNERARIEAEVKHKDMLTDEARQNVKNKSLDATKKTVDMMKGLEGEGQEGLEETPQTK